MDDFDEFNLEYDRMDINSELRHLTLELMKIAIRKNKSFEEVAKEFVKNVYYLKDLILNLEKEASLPRSEHEAKHKQSHKHH